MFFLENKAEKNVQASTFIIKNQYPFIDKKTIDLVFSFSRFLVFSPGSGGLIGCFVVCRQSCGYWWAKATRCYCAPCHEAILSVLGGGDGGRKGGSGVAVLVSAMSVAVVVGSI